MCLPEEEEAVPSFFLLKKALKSSIDIEMGISALKQRVSDDIHSS
jgi:hypothetical protein